MIGWCCEVVNSTRAFPNPGSVTNCTKRSTRGKVNKVAKGSDIKQTYRTNICLADFDIFGNGILGIGVPPHLIFFTIESPKHISHSASMVSHYTLFSPLVTVFESFYTTRYDRDKYNNLPNLWFVISQTAKKVHKWGNVTILACTPICNIIFCPPHNASS